MGIRTTRIMMRVGTMGVIFSDLAPVSMFIYHGVEGASSALHLLALDSVRIRCWEELGIARDTSSWIQELPGTSDMQLIHHLPVLGYSRTSASTLPRYCTEGSHLITSTRPLSYRGP